MLPGSDREAVGGMRGDQGKPESSSPWKQHFQFFTFACFRGSRMKEVMSNNSTTSISQARKAVEQLKMEACMDRVKVSQAAADLLAYCEAHVREDPLIIPVPASENPFREKKFFCTIL
uniref:Guanine nucleotide-binding protein subunit gamma n=2 Tax=Canis lupus familiaris TaxID=9615 RepID=A0A8I3MHA7_CANLF|nr:heterotrimeric guanine nucleotide-binding protein 3C [Canis lupus familiaris]